MDQALTLAWSPTPGIVADVPAQTGQKAGAQILRFRSIHAARIRPGSLPTEE